MGITANDTIAVVGNTRLANEKTGTVKVCHAVGDCKINICRSGRGATTKCRRWICKWDQFKPSEIVIVAIADAAIANEILEKANAPRKHPMERLQKNPKIFGKRHYCLTKVTRRWKSPVLTGKSQGDLENANLGLVKSRRVDQANAAEK